MKQKRANFHKYNHLNLTSIITEIIQGLMRNGPFDERQHIFTLECIKVKNKAICAKILKNRLVTLIPIITEIMQSSTRMFALLKDHI